MQKLDIPELNSKEIEELCSIAEEAVREYVTSKVPLKRIETWEIMVETEGAKPVTLTIETEVSLSPLMKNFDIQKVVDEAVRKAYASSEEYLRKLKCRSQK